MNEEQLADCVQVGQSKRTAQTDLHVGNQPIEPALERFSAGRLRFRSASLPVFRIPIGIMLRLFSELLECIASVTGHIEQTESRWMARPQAIRSRVPRPDACLRKRPQPRGRQPP